MDYRDRIIARQFNKAKQVGSPYIKWAISENINVWYVLLHNITGDEGEYVSGEYLCKLVLPADFPHHPPEFYLMTPNGTYECNKKVCIHIGEFHANQYPATLGVCGFTDQLISGLIGWRHLNLTEGIGLLATTVEAKKKYAADSKTYNLVHHADIMRMF